VVKTKEITMPYAQFDRRRIQFRPLAERRDRVYIERDYVSPDMSPSPLTPQQARVLSLTAERLHAAVASGRSRMLTFGAHSIKNGLGPLIIQFLEEGWFTHLATNGAGIIHDWEFAFQGHSSEYVKENAARGQFGAWQETGFYINLALNVGAFRGLGYGEAVGAFVEEEGLTIPSPEELHHVIHSALERGAYAEAAAAADLLTVITDFDISPGRMAVPHPYKRFGLQAAAYRKRIPFTGHPMFGHDIIYEHPMNQGAGIGRTAERDFLAFVESVSHLDGGVYLSIGSAVMSPMIFEKSFSMAMNVALQQGTPIRDHWMVVVDLQPTSWDWSRGEPPETHPDYYIRFNKSFSRMGGTLHYLCMDNRDFLLALYRALHT